MRADGYWFIPFLRAQGTDLAGAGAPGLAAPAAEHALARFAALFGDIAAPPPPAGIEAREEARRFDRGEIGVLITGPWAVPDLALPATIVASPLPGAPRGGQLLAVPRCASRPADGWALAAALTGVEVQVELARRFATVPTRTAALAKQPGAGAIDPRRARRREGAAARSDHAAPVRRPQAGGRRGGRRRCDGGGGDRGGAAGVGEAGAMTREPWYDDRGTDL